MDYRNGIVMIVWTFLSLCWRKDREWARVLGHAIFLGMVAYVMTLDLILEALAILEGATRISVKSWLIRTLAFDERFATHFTFS